MTREDKKFLKECKQIFKSCGYNGKIKSMSEMYSGGTFNAFGFVGDSATFATVYTNDNGEIIDISVNTKYYSVNDKLKNYLNSIKNK